MVIIDTSIIIDHLRQAPGTDSFFIKLLDHFSRHDLAFSLISVQELYVGQSTKDSEKERTLLVSLQGLQALSYTYEIAKFAGQIIREEKRVMGFADAAIAATTISYGARLFTLNTKDFTGIKDLALFTS